MKTPLFLSLSLLAPSLVSAATIAQSSDQFSGIQGNGNWYYGYYDRSADLGGGGDGVYQTAEFTEFLGGAGAGAWGDTNHWNSTTWDYNPPGASNGNPPWTNIGAGNTHPNDNNPGPEHHSVRRWVSGVTGEVNISGLFNNVSASGDGTVGQVWVNGSLLSANTTDGSSANFNHDVYVTPGSTIDFVVTPNNPADDGSDGTNFQATMTMSSIADSVADFSGIQGQGGWFYGYYDRTADLAGAGDGLFQASEFTQFLGGVGAGAWGDTNHWNGTAWDFNPVGASDGNPPWTTIAAGSAHPADNNPGPEHWTVQRWISDVNHEVNLGAYFFNTSAAGDGTLGEIYINGIQVFSGLSDGPNTSANYYGQHLLQIGDVVDFVVTPNNPADDGNDGTNWRSFISLTPEPSRAMLLVLGLGAMLVRRRR